MLLTHKYNYVWVASNYILLAKLTFILRGVLALTHFQGSFPFGGVFSVGCTTWQDKFLFISCEGLHTPLKNMSQQLFYKSFKIYFLKVLFNKYHRLLIHNYHYLGGDLCHWTNLVIKRSNYFKRLIGFYTQSRYHFLISELFFPLCWSHHMTCLY